MYIQLSILKTFINIRPVQFLSCAPPYNNTQKRHNYKTNTNYKQIQILKTQLFSDQTSCCRKLFQLTKQSLISVRPLSVVDLFAWYKYKIQTQIKIQIYSNTTTNHKAVLYLCPPSFSSGGPLHLRQIMKQIFNGCVSKSSPMPLPIQATDTDGFWMITYIRTNPSSTTITISTQTRSDFV